MADAKNADDDVTLVTDSDDGQSGTVRAPQTQDTAGRLLADGTVVDGSYTVLRYLGAGAFGEVYKVRHEGMQKDLALKLLRGNDVSDTVKSRFVQEVQVMARLQHDNIVKIYNSGIYSDNCLYYVMDLVDGVSLADMIVRDGHVKVSDALAIFIAVAGALSAAHQRHIIHRDIKPANIIIATGDGAIGDRVRVVDFGIAKLLGRTAQSAQALTALGQVFGSPLYMSPEQCGGGTVDGRSDIYSLGCALFEALTGVVPLKGANAMKTFELHCTAMAPSLKNKAPQLDFDSALEEVVAQLLAKNPDERYQTMEQVKQALERVAANPARSQSFSRSSKDASSASAEPVASANQAIKKSPLAILSLALVATSLLSAGLYFAFARQPGAALKHTSVEPFVAPGYVKKAVIESPWVAPVTSDSFDSFLKPVSDDQYFKSLDGKGAAMYDLPHVGEHSIGGVSYSPNQNSMYYPLSGRFVIQPGTNFTFRPESVVGLNPTIIKGFRRVDVTGIDLLSIKASDFRKVLHGAVSRYDNLRMIAARPFFVDDAVIREINRVKGLQVLGIDGLKASTAQLLQIKRLSELNDFELCNFSDDVSPVLDRVLTKNLATLSLINVKLTEADLQKIARCGSICTLRLNRVGMQRNWVRHLLALHNLRDLSLANDNESIDWIEPLRPFKQLGELVIYDKKWDDITRSDMQKTFEKALAEPGRRNNPSVRCHEANEVASFSANPDSASEIAPLLK